MELGAEDVELTDYAVVLATIPATIERKVPTVAFLAHVDTSPGFNATGVKPIVHRDYDGSTIVLPDDTSMVLSPEEFPYLGEKIGDDVVTASGTTLLGADDKAGVAIIMAAAKALLADRSIPHGPIRIAFSASAKIASPAIQSRFMTPPTNKSAMSTAQQPRQ